MHDSIPLSVIFLQDEGPDSDSSSGSGSSSGDAEDVVLMEVFCVANQQSVPLSHHCVME